MGQCGSITNGVWENNHITSSQIYTGYDKTQDPDYRHRCDTCASGYVNNYGRTYVDDDGIEWSLGGKLIEGTRDDFEPNDFVEPALLQMVGPVDTQQHPYDSNYNGEMMALGMLEKDNDIVGGYPGRCIPLWDTKCPRNSYGGVTIPKNMFFLDL